MDAMIGTPARRVATRRIVFELDLTAPAMRQFVIDEFGQWRLETLNALVTRNGDIIQVEADIHERDPSHD